MHMRIQLTASGQYILGQFSRPFNNIAEMINYYTVRAGRSGQEGLTLKVLVFQVNRLPIKGAEHVSLKIPLCEQLL